MWNVLISEYLFYRSTEGSSEGVGSTSDNIGSSTVDENSENVKDEPQLTTGEKFWTFCIIIIHE